MTTRHADQSVSLLQLVTRLVADLDRFVDQRLDLLKAELKQEARSIATGLGVLAAGAVGVGVAFLLLALGLWVGHLVGSTPGGLAIVGGGLALIGAGPAYRPAPPDPTSASAEGEGRLT